MQVLTLILAYFVLILLVGLFVGKRTKDMTDYMVGGRNLGVWVVSLGIMAAVMSGWTWLGNPGSSYSGGYASVITYTVFSPLGLVVSYFIIAKPVRIISEKFDCYTLPDILAARWNDNKTIRLLSGFVILIGSATYLVSQWISMGTAVQVALGIEYRQSVIIGAIIITVYIMAGGMLASMWTNFIQMIIMFVVALILVCVGFEKVGGFVNMNEQIAAIDPQMLEPWHSGGGILSICFVMSYTVLMLTLAYGGQPAVNTKYMMIKNKKLLKWSPFISVVALITGTLTVYVGLQGRVLVENGVLPAPERQDTILLDVINYIFPTKWTGVFLVAILAAVMSTAESYLFSSATSIVQDIIVKSFNVKIEEKKMLLLTRVVMIIIAILTVIIALSPPSLISLIGTQAFGTFCAGFGPVVYLGLRWKRMSSKAAIAGMMVGLLVGGCFPIINNLFFEGALLSNWTIGGIGVVMAYITSIVATFVTKEELSKVFL